MWANYDIIRRVWIERGVYSTHLVYTILDEIVDVLYGSSSNPNRDPNVAMMTAGARLRR